MAKTKTKANAKQKKQGEPKEQRKMYPYRCNILDVRVGDRIVESVDENGLVGASTLIKEKEYQFDSCRGVHINRQSCYPTCVPVRIALTEEQTAERIWDAK